MQPRTLADKGQRVVKWAADLPAGRFARYTWRMSVGVFPMAVFLFLSGMCALVYQVAWLREFRLVFGATTAASAAVLAVFMGGLGLGNALLGQRADRHRKPLLWYAKLEFAVALTAAASPWLIDVCRWIYCAVGGQLSLGASGATVVRLLLSVLVLGPPTILMGGTLPAAICAVETSEDVTRRQVGRLYGINTLGAVLGTLLSTFWLLETCGTRNTLWGACLLNLLLSLGAYLLGWRVYRSPSDQRTPEGVLPAKATAAVAKPTPHDALSNTAAHVPARLIFAAAATVGFSFFLMELVWYRMLAPVLGGTTYTFGLIVAVALAGIGIGGALYAFLFQYRAPTLGTLAASCALEALCLAFPFALGDRIALLAWLLRSLSVFGFAGEVFGWSAVAAIVIFPAAMVSGVQFPLLIALLGQGRQKVGRQVGLATAWNTGGAIFGSLAGGFGLLPLLSAPGAWRAVVVLLCAVAMLAMAYAWRHGRRSAALPVPLLAVGLALAALVATGPTAVWRHGGIGAGRTVAFPGSPNALRNVVHGQRRLTIWEAEGREASIAINDHDGYSFLVNGKSDGNAVGDAGTQVMSGLLGAILHPNPKTSLVVGLGTGETAGWLAEVASMEQVDVVELEPAVDEMARRCAPINHNMLYHPKVRRIYNDGREVLLTTSARYDLIVSEPSNPYRAGVASLYTREFYAAAQKRLNSSGLFLQFLQAYEIDPQTLQITLATLRSVFPYVEVWNTIREDDLTLVAAMEPIQYPVAQLRDRIAQEPFKSALAVTWWVTDLEGVLAHRQGGPGLVEQITKQQVAPWNTDDCTILEYRFAKTVGQTELHVGQDLLIAGFVHSDDRPPVTDGPVSWEYVDDQRLLTIVSVMRTVPPELTLSFEQQARAESLKCYAAGDLQETISHWESQPRPPQSFSELSILAEAHAALGHPKAELLLDQLRPVSPTQAEILLGILHFQQTKYGEATDDMVAAFERLHHTPWMMKGYGVLALMVATEVAHRDPSQAPRLLAALQEPFALHQCQTKRLNTALAVAREIGATETANVLHKLEPFVPWDEDALRRRAESYTAAGDPLAVQAKKDLEEYLRGKPQPLIFGQPDSACTTPATADDGPSE
jgi:spermidine synthase